MTVIMTGKPHAPDVIDIISESLFSLFYTALLWVYDERNWFGTREYAPYRSSTWFSVYPISSAKVRHSECSTV
jgi:hypothetical protein